jgi:hypothetical protein
MGTSTHHLETASNIIGVWDSYVHSKLNAIKSNWSIEFGRFNDCLTKNKPSMESHSLSV